jgi:O-antigen/teichoic acid export membrane protein
MRDAARQQDECTGMGPGNGVRRVSANVRWVMAGNVAYVLGGWIQLILLARAGGGAAVGVYSLALALTAPITNFAGLQLGALLSSDTRRTYAFREYRRLRACTTALAVVAIALVGWSSGLRGEAALALALVALMRAADASGDVYFAAWQRAERMREIGVGMALNAGLSAGAMGASVGLGLGVTGAIAGAVLGSLGALAFVCWRTARDPELSVDLAERARGADGRRLLRLGLEALPLGVIVLLTSLQQNVPRYFVQHAGGEAALGLFAAAAQLTGAGGIVVAALGRATTPRFAWLLASGDLGGFRALARKTAATGLLLGAGGAALSVIAGAPILALLFGEEFARAAPVLVVLSVAAGFGFVGSLLGYALTAGRVIAVQPVLLTFTLVALVAASVALVPAHGSVGAAWALTIAAAVHALASAIVLRRLRAANGEAAPAPAGAAPTTGAR